MEAGRHVLVEKPLTDSFAAATAVREAARHRDSVFQVGYCVRSSQLIRKTLEVIRSGNIGEVVFVWWQMFLKAPDRTGTWRRERSLAGGKLFDCGCHYFDVLQLLAGAPFVRVSAFGTGLGQTGPNADRVPDVAAVILEFANGAKGSHSLSEHTPTAEQSFFGVAGTRGIIYGDPWMPEKAGSLNCVTHDGLYKERIVISGDKASGGHLGFFEQHDAFLDAILDGGVVPCSVEDAHETARLLAAVDRSLATGQTVTREEIQ
jgi:predicted dehydrogenase